MTSRASIGRIALTVVTLVGLSACERDLSLLEPAPFPSDAEVFGDALGPGLGWFQPFAGSKLDAFQFDESVAFQGSGSIRVDVPGPGDPSGGYAGGALVANVPRDLSGYNALTFWARGSASFTLNVAGLGNNNTGTSIYTAEVGNAFRIASSWQKYVIPIPDATRLTREDGIFFLAEGSETGSAYSLWIDEMKFERLTTFANRRAALPTSAVNGEVGAELAITGGTYTVDVGGTDITVATAPAYFEYTSSDPSVAAVTTMGTVQLVGPGTATITGSLAGISADGALTVNVTLPPTVAAPTPDEPAEEVVSLYSDAYQDVTVDTWSAPWDAADVEDIQIAGDNVKKYTNMVFAGIEFTSAPVDASQRTTLHMDVWAATADFKVKLVDFGGDGAFGGGDDSEFELALNAGTDPAIQVNAWNSLDIPMSAFTGLASREHLAQMIISSASPTVYIDNVYFHGTVVVETPQEPETAAPTPTHAPGNVVSMFSNAYTDVTVDTWSASWDVAVVEDVQIAGDDVKKYTGLSFAGIEATSAPIDASAMTRFHMDIWTPDATDTGAFKVKLVDFGANGSFQGGDDTEFELTFTATSDPALATGTWVSIDVPLSDFTGMTTGAIAQMIISGDPNTVFVDNVYFYSVAGAAPAGQASGESNQDG